MTEKWNTRYATATLGEAAWVLREYAHLLPARGQALDLACGLGANALFLAERGLAVSAWDVSSVAIERLRVEAVARQLSIAAVVRDVLNVPPLPASLDVIVVAHFLQRDVFPALLTALRPGGVLFYQTFTSERVIDVSTPSNPEFLLAPNELRELAQPLRLLAYREDGLCGDLTQGRRALAALVGLKT